MIFEFNLLFYWIILFESIFSTQLTLLSSKTVFFQEIFNGSIKSFSNDCTLWAIPAKFLNFRISEKFVENLLENYSPSSISFSFDFFENNRMFFFAFQRKFSFFLVSLSILTKINLKSLAFSTSESFKANNSILQK